MSSFSTESIIVSCIGYGLVIIGSIAKYVLSLKKRGTVAAIVIPPNSGKTQLVKTFNEIYNMSITDYYLIDIEQKVYDSSLITEQRKTELKALKEKNDLVHYEAVLMHSCNVIYSDIIQQLLRETKRKVIVLCSSDKIRKYLGIKRVINFLPSATLSREIISTEGVAVDWYQYCRIQIDINAKNTLIFTEYKELLTILEDSLKLTKK